MASTLYILLPSKVTAQATADWTHSPRPFAALSANGTIEQQGCQTLSQLKPTLMQVRQVVLLLAAGDVSLLQAKVPPMAASKLRMSLPNLLEDQLSTEASEVILQPVSIVDGICTVAAVDKAWMESVNRTLLAFGAKKVHAYPSQMAMEYRAGATSVLLDHENAIIEFAAHRFDGSYIGLGLGLDQTISTDAGQQAAGVFESLQALSLFVPESEVTVYLDVKAQEAFQQALTQDAGLSQRLTLQALNWKHRIAGLDANTPDLLAGISALNQSSVDWRTWRWPLGLGLAALLINMIGLNIEWWSLKREAQALTASMTQAYRSAYPKESVIIDPLAQMQQKISVAKKLSGQSSPDDFVVLAAQFAQVWDRLAPNVPGASVLGLEYRERNLFVRTRSFNAADQLKTSLQEQALMLVSFKDGILQIKPVSGSPK
ncbi:type II secretion system protein GspL [Undibacterium sp. Jales W-56]|uniref:type II secretion system protein GspL n=1 Tax=Undibacterium sp. Jales W-56 TaxID=2897325 RepID=UPI0021D0C2F3|nr:type II secretion system protein GspL [Undibacterium sp. Jales W-56]MCU6433143.1 type II secretion system protein GspL [Undibacterium sp. Jales W-56]